MSGDPLRQFISYYTYLRGYSVRNTKRVAVIPVSPVWLTYLKSALLCSSILVNNYIVEIIDSKYDSREEHQYIRSHDNYYKKERIRKMRQDHLLVDKEMVQYT